MKIFPSSTTLQFCRLTRTVLRQLLSRRPARRVALRDADGVHGVEAAPLSRIGPRLRGATVGDNTFGPFAEGSRRRGGENIPAFTYLRVGRRGRARTSEVCTKDFRLRLSSDRKPKTLEGRTVRASARSKRQGHVVLVEKAEEDHLKLWACLSCGALNLY